jgi:hypothetical protein
MKIEPNIFSLEEFAKDLRGSKIRKTINRSILALLAARSSPIETSYIEQRCLETLELQISPSPIGKEIIDEKIESECLDPQAFPPQEGVRLYDLVTDQLFFLLEQGYIEEAPPSNLQKMSAPFGEDAEMLYCLRPGQHRFLYMLFKII